MEAPPIFAFCASQACASYDMRLLPGRYHIYSNSIRKEHCADLGVMFDSGFARTRRFRLVGVAVNGTQSDDSFLLC